MVLPWLGSCSGKSFDHWALKMTGSTGHEQKRVKPLTFRCLRNLSRSRKRRKGKRLCGSRRHTWYSTLLWYSLKQIEAELCSQEESGLAVLPVSTWKLDLQSCIRLIVITKREKKSQRYIVQIRRHIPVRERETKEIHEIGNRKENKQKERLRKGKQRPEKKQKEGRTCYSACCRTETIFSFLCNGKDKEKKTVAEKETKIGYKRQSEKTIDKDDWQYVSRKKRRVHSKCSSSAKQEKEGGLEDDINDKPCKKCKPYPCSLMRWWQFLVISCIARKCLSLTFPLRHALGWL